MHLHEYISTAAWVADCGTAGWSEEMIMLVTKSLCDFATYITSYFIFSRTGLCPCASIRMNRDVPVMQINTKRFNDLGESIDS